MGYHFEDFFEDTIKENLKQLLNNNPEPEEFIQFFNRMIHSSNGDLLSKQLLKIISEKDAFGPVHPDEAVWNLFTLLYPDVSLRKVEYATDSGTLVNIDYFGVKEDE